MLSIYFVFGKGSLLWSNSLEVGHTSNEQLQYDTDMPHILT